MTIGPTPNRRRRAFTLLEVIVTAAMLGAVLGLATQIVAAVNRHSRAAEHHAIALRTLENCLEQVAALPWDEVETAAITSALLPADLREHWPAAQLTGEVKPSEQPLVAKQIKLRLTLSSAPPARPTHLTTWIYRTPR